MRSSYSFVFRLCLCFCGLITAILISEAGIRIIAPQMTGPSGFSFHPELGAVPVPNQRGFRSLPGVYIYQYSNDKSGHRNVESTVKDIQKPLLLFLGDSFTYGVGVNDGQTFASIVQAFSPDYRVVNAGNGGKGTDYSLKYLLTRGSKLRPETIAIGFFKNDFCDNTKGTYFDVTVSDELIVKDLTSSIGARKNFLQGIPGYSWLISHSHLASLFKSSAITVLQRFSSARASKWYSDGSIPSSGCANSFSRRLTSIFLRKIKNIARDLDSRLILFYIPERQELVSNAASLDEQAFLEIARELDVEAGSMRQVLLDDEHEVGELYFEEGHWTPVGHQIAAAFLLSALKK